MNHTVTQNLRLVTPVLVTVAVLLLGMVLNRVESIDNSVDDVRERVAAIEASLYPPYTRRPTP